MTAEDLVCDRLLATSGVTSLVGTRIYQLKLPQAPTYPAIRVQVITDVKGYHLRGEDGAVRTRVQVDAFDGEANGDAYLSASNVAEAVREALSGQVFTNTGSPVVARVLGCLADGRRPLYTPDELRQVGISQDFIVWSAAA